MKQGSISFLKQLATLLKAGVPLTRALRIINGQESSIIHLLESGLSFSESLARIDLYKDQISSFRIAERDGRLEEAILRAAEQMERKRSLRENLNKALIYPAIILGTSILCLIFLLFFVLPNFARLFADFNCSLPPLTRFLMKLPDFWLVFLAAMISSIVFMVKLWHNIDFRFKIPFLGKIFLNLALGEVLYNLGSQIKAGVPILESIRSVVDGSRSAIIKRSLEGIYSDIQLGQSPSYAFSKIPIFPNYLVGVLAVGEESGSIDEMMISAGAVFEQQAEQILKTMTLMIEPAATLTLGLIVGVIALAMVMPLFSMMNSVL